jgi:hypothetical protein
MPQNGELLDKLDARIAKKLEKKLTPMERDHYEMMEIFVTYLKADHPKVTRMWNTYIPMAFVMSAAVLAFIGAVASGRLSIVVK